MVLSQFILAPIGLLILASLLSLIFKGKTCNYVVSILVSIASLIMIYAGLRVISTGEPITYNITLYKISGLTLGLNRFIFTIDYLSAFFITILGILGLAVSIYNLKYMEIYMARESMRFFGFNFSSLTLVMFLVLVVYDIFWFIIFWELMTVTSQFLVSYVKEREQARFAGYKYFFMVKAGSELIVVSVLLILIYLTVDTSYIAVKQTLLETAKINPGLVAALFILLFLGLGVKAAIYPLHTWLPGAYSEAPSSVSAMLSGIMEKIAIYMMIRSFYWFPIQTLFAATALIMSLVKVF